MGFRFAGRPPINFADSVKGVITLDHPYAKAIMDRQKEVDQETIDAVLGQSLFSWEDRHPRPALDENGNFQCTDLDLLSFLAPFADRRAVIEISRYRNRRKIVVRDNERRIGSSKFGPVTGITSNKDVFSFSVRIFDGSVVVKDPVTELETVGAHRNYMLVDCDGHWYDGWDRIVWDPTRSENDFLTKNGLWTGNTVYFKNYVHPNRWQSIFGAPYFLKKMLVSRLDDEAGFYRQEMKRLEDGGITLPEGEKKPYVPSIHEGKTESVKVGSLEALLDLPDFSGAYASVPATQAGLVDAYRRQKHLTWTVKPAIQFVIRANEAAYYRYGEGRVANWMGTRSWKSWKAPKGKIEWRHMVLSNQCAFRIREKSVTEQISAD